MVFTQVTKNKTTQYRLAPLIRQPGCKTDPAIELHNPMGDRRAGVALKRLSISTAAWSSRHR